MCRFIVRGRVFSGVGEGGFYVSIYSKQFRRSLGFTPYPGTLNVRLDHPLDLSPCKSIRVEPPEIPGARLGGVLALPARLNGVDVYIVRPEITVYKGDVVEFIAPKYLRGLLGLRDGDEVEIEVECCGGEGAS